MDEILIDHNAVKASLIEGFKALFSSHWKLWAFKGNEGKYYNWIAQICKAQSLDILPSEQLEALSVSLKETEKEKEHLNTVLNESKENFLARLQEGNTAYLKLQETLKEAESNLQAECKKSLTFKELLDRQTEELEGYKHGIEGYKTEQKETDEKLTKEMISHEKLKLRLSQIKEITNG